MELKGYFADKIPEAKKEKMLETLKRMEDTRRKDDMYLRDEINKKINEITQLKEEIKINLKAIDKEFKAAAAELEKEFTEKVSKYNIRLIKIDGQLETLNELMELENKEDSIPEI